MARITDSSDVTMPGFTVVGAVRKVLVGTDTGIRRIQGNLTYAAPWVGEEVLSTGDVPVHALIRGGIHDTVVAALAADTPGAMMTSERGTVWDQGPGWSAGRPLGALGFAEDGAVLAGGLDGSLWRSPLEKPEWEEPARFAELRAAGAWSAGHGGSTPRVTHLERDPRKPSRWMASIARGGVLASEDDGVHWIQASPAWETYAALYSLGNNAFAATAEGLFKSRDRGRTWESTPVFSGRIPAVARDAGGQLFAVLAEGNPARVVHSIDDGETWEPVPGGDELPLPPSGTAAMVADKVRPNVFLYGTGDSVWLRDEGGVRKAIEGLPPIRSLLVL